MRIIEGGIFLGLAIAAHLGIWAGTHDSSDVAATAASGQDSVTVQAASAQHAALAAAWTQPPEAVTTLKTAQHPEVVPAAVQPIAAEQHVTLAALPEAPRLRGSGPMLPKQPQPTQPPRMSALEVPKIAQPVAPQIAPTGVSPQSNTPRNPSPVQPSALASVNPSEREFTAPPLPDLPALSPRVAENIAASPRPPMRPAAPRRAAGLGRDGATQSLAQREVPAATAAPTQSASRANALRAQWGATIQAKVRRAVRYPSGTQLRGRTKLALSIAPSGALQSVQVMRSSGHAALDDAALRAVKRVRRFARAPQDLRDDTYRFAISVDFNG